jgi:hypothetical protein
MIALVVCRKLRLVGRSPMIAALIAIGRGSTVKG